MGEQMTMTMTPQLEFIDNWRGECPPAVIARLRTGHDRESGRRTLGVGLRNRSNGTTTRFEMDLWRLGYDLSDRAQKLVRDYWQHQNRDTPAHVQKHMERHFSRTFLQFDAMREQTDHWKDFLKATLTDAASYIEILAVRRRQA